MKKLLNSKTKKIIAVLVGVMILLLVLAIGWKYLKKETKDQVNKPIQEVNHEEVFVDPPFEDDTFERLDANDFEINSDNKTISFSKNIEGGSFCLSTSPDGPTKDDVWFTANEKNEYEIENVSDEAQKVYVYYSAVTVATMSTYTADASVYTIATAADLEAFRAQVNNKRVSFSGKKVVLLNNVSGANVQASIGITACNFSGTFDGRGYTITNFGVNSTGVYSVFAKITGARIQNLTVGGSRQGADDAVGVAAIVDQARGSTIKNCVNNTSIVAATEAAGIVNYAYKCTISNCVNNGNITAKGTAGGIVATIINDSTVIDCVNKGTITVSGTFETHYSIGGIVGVAHNGLVKNCVNTGTMTVTRTGKSGGIIGAVEARGSLEVYNCKNIASSFTCAASGGGIVGSVEDDDADSTEIYVVTIKYCTNDTPITLRTYYNVGGIVGYVDEPVKVIVSHCKNTGLITADGNYTKYATDPGGIAGDFGRGTIEYCINTGNIVNDQRNGGGIIGHHQGTGSVVSVDSCINTGNVTDTAQYEHVNHSNGTGGIIGTINNEVENKSGTKIYINNCGNEGLIKTNKYNAGAMIGVNYGSKTTCIVSNSYSIAKQTASTNPPGTAHRITGIGDYISHSNYYSGTGKANPNTSLWFENLYNTGDYWIQAWQISPTLIRNPFNVIDYVGTTKTIDTVWHTPADYTTYQWYVATSETGSGTAVSGATSTSLSVTVANTDKWYYCVATGVNETGAAVTVTTDRALVSPILEETYDAPNGSGVNVYLMSREDQTTDLNGNSGYFNLYALGAERAGKTQYTADKIETITFQNSDPRTLSGVVDSWDVSYGEGGTIWAAISDSNSDGMYDMFIGSDIGPMKFSNCDEFFDSHINLIAINNLEIVDTSESPSMYCMFEECEKLISVNTSNFDTKNVTTMYGMFFRCYALPNIDVTSFNTSNVTDMGLMFSSCKAVSNLNVSGFDTSKATNMGYMFSNCQSLTNLDVSGFNTSNVTTMDCMFLNCKLLTTIDVSNFNTSKVTLMNGMFGSCEKVQVLDVSKFNTSNVTNMSNMFQSCNSISTLDVSKFDTSKVTEMQHMLSNCFGLNTVDVSNWNTSNVTNFEYMFSSSYNLRTLDVSKFNTSKATTMQAMFNGLSFLPTINVSNFNTSQVTNMRNMFYGCSSLTSLNVSGFNTSNVTNMHSMFESCSSLTSLDLSGFNTSKVTDMVGMFYKCSGLTSLNVSEFNTSNVTDMSYLFYKCSSLRSLLLGPNFNKMNGYNMFSTTTNLTAIIAQKTSAMTLSTDIGVSSSTVLYVPNTTAEAAYEAATNYSSVFGASRVKPMLGLAGSNPTNVAYGGSYSEQGATVAGFSTSEATNYTQYGYTLSGPVIKKGSTTVSSVNTSSPGTYTLTYTLTYKDTSKVATTTAARTVNVNKGIPTFSVSPTSLSLKKGESKTITITYNGDGTLSASSSATGIATASLSSKTITVTGVAVGNVNITVSATAGTNYAALNPISVPVNVTVSDATLIIKPNGGSYNGSASDTVLASTEGTTISLYEPIRSGYKFNGWSSSGGGTLNQINYVGYKNPRNSTISTNSNRDLVIVATNNDPSVSYYPYFSASTVKKIRLTMDNPASTNSVQIFFSTGSSLNETNSAYGALSANVTNQVTTVDFSSKSGWTGTITELRIDPGSAAGTYVIKKIEYLDASNNVVMIHDDFTEKGYTYTYGATAGTLTANWTAANYMVGDKYYATLEAAHAAISTSGTITVQTSNTDASSITFASGKNITLNLNGKTITKTTYGIGNNGTLTINGSGTITTATDASNAISSLIVNAGTLTVNGGTLTNTGMTNNYWYVINTTTGTTNIKGGTLNATLASGVTPKESFNARAMLVGSGTINVSGGTITSRDFGIHCWQNSGKLNISGGTLTAGNNNAINFSGTGVSGTITIIGGTVTSTRNTAVTNSGTGATTIGTSGGGVSKSSPIIQGASYAVAATNGFNFYDGILKGITAAYSGTVNPESEYTVVAGTEEISGATYNTAYLKLTPSFSVSPTTLGVNKGAKGTIAITYIGDATLTAVSSNTGVATVGLSGQTITVTGVKGGTATVTVSAKGGTNYADATDKTVSVTVYEAPTTPTITVKNASGTAIASGKWSTSNLTISVGSSTLSGPGSVGYEYSYNNSTWTTYSSAITYSTETSSQVIYVRAYNKSATSMKSGNVTYTIKLDKTKPTVTAELDNGSDGSWSSKAVSIKVTGNDSNSGVSLIQYSTNNSTWTTINTVNSTNLLKNSDFSETTAVNFAWDKSLNEGTKANSWSDGYNGGVSQPTIGYHAHINTTDFDFNTLKFVNKNSTVNSSIKGRWLGLAQSVEAGTIKANTTYTLSYDVYSDTAGTRVRTGAYYTQTSGTTGNGFHNGQNDSITAADEVGKWVRKTYTFTTTSALNEAAAVSIYLYGHYGNEGIIYVKNVQLETGSNATAWQPATADQTAAQKDGVVRVDGSFNGTYYFRSVDAAGNISSTVSKTIKKDNGGPEVIITNNGSSITSDPSFANGKNGTYVYNNSANGNVIHTRKMDSTAPNDSGYVLHISTIGTCSPGLGGFYFATPTAANETYVAKIIAKIPTGYTINLGSNALGTGFSYEWLTSQAGTNDWATYVLYIRTGSSGTFSTTNFFYLTGSGTTVEWDVAYANIYSGNIIDWTNGNITITGTSLDSAAGTVGYAFTTTQTAPTSWTTVSSTTSTVTGTTTASANGNVYFWAKDSLGNISMIATKVERIDKTGPVIGVNNIKYEETATITLSDAASGLLEYKVTTTNSEPTSWDTAAASQTYKPSSAGTHYVWAKDNAGNVNSKSFTVYSSPSISSHPASVSVNEGTSPTFTVGVTGGVPSSYTYKWYYNNSNSNSGGVVITTSTTGATCTGVTSATMTLANIDRSWNNYYVFAEVSNGQYSVRSNPALIKVNDATAPTKPTFVIKFNDDDTVHTNGQWTNRYVYTVISSTDAVGVTKFQYSSTPTVESSWKDLGLGKSGGISKSGTTYTGAENWGLTDRNEVHYFRAVDAAGNKSQPSDAYYVKYDVTAPTVPTFVIKYISNDAVHTNGQWATGEVYTVLTSTDSVGVESFQYTSTPSDENSWGTLNLNKSGGISNSGTTYTGAETWTWRNRNQTFYFRAIDTVGNKSAASEAYYVKYDTTKPSVSLSATNNANSVSLTASISDSSYGVIGYAWTNSSSTPTSWTTMDQTTSTTQTKSITSAGAQYIHVKDIGGNVSSANITVYSVAYNANGGSGAPATQYKANGVGLTLSSTTPTRANYTFIGWNTAANGSGISYVAGATYSANEDVTLYAQWSINTSTLTINPNGGSYNGTTSNTTLTNNSGTTVSVYDPIRVGYKFNGWTLTGGGTLAETDMYGYRGPNVSTLSVNSDNDLVITATGGDPYFYLDTNFSASTVKKIRLTYNSTSATTAQIFFSTGASMSETNSVSVTAPTVGVDTTRVFDFSSKSGWTGIVKQLRFDPGRATGTYIFKKVEFLDANDNVVLTHDNFNEKGYKYTYTGTAGTLTANWTEYAAPTAPTITVKNASGTTITSGNWATSTLTITLSGGTLNGPGSIGYEYSYDNSTWTKYTEPFTYNTETSSKTLYARSYNVSDITKTSSNTTFTIKLDTAKPTTEATLDNGEDGAWTNQPVSIKVTGKDVASGVSKIEYSTNNSTWTELNTTTSPNLLLNSDLSKTTTTNPGWDTTLNGTTMATSWANGYNGGVASPEKGYHAHVNTTDFDFNTIKFINKNSEVGLTKRWLGITQSLSEGVLKENTTYTLSYDVYADVAGDAINLGIHHYITGSTSRAFYSGTGTSTISANEVGKWVRKTFTFTTTSTLDTTKASVLYIYGYTGPEGTRWVKNVQLEQASAATAWTPHVNDQTTNEKDGVVLVNENFNGTYYFRSTDAVGNVSTTVSKAIKVDLSAPVIGVSNINYGGTATITLSDEGGSGLAGYKVTSANSQPTSWDTAAASQTYKPSSAGTYYVWAKDGAGNISSTSFTTNKIDNTLIVTGKSLTYNGEAQALVTAASVQGTVYYAVGTELTSSNYSTAGSTTIPSQTNAGTYKVYYYTTGNANYNVKSGNVDVTIAKYSLSNATIASISAQTYTGSAIKPTPAVTVPIPSGKTTTLTTTDFAYGYSNNTNAGTATVTVTANSASTNYTGSKSATFTINKATPSLSGPATTVQVGQTLSVTYTYNGDGNVTVTSGTTSVATISSVDKTNKKISIKGVAVGESTITITAAEGTNHKAATATFKVTVTDSSISIATNPVDVAVKEGVAASFSVVANGTNVGYQWYKASSSTGAGTAITGATSATYTLTVSAGLDGTYYYCVVTNSTGSATSTKAKLTVYSAPTITKHPTAVAVKHGASPSFTVEATGGNPSTYTYRWLYNRTNTNEGGTAITAGTSGATNVGYNTSTLTLQNIQWSGWNNWYLFAEVSNGQYTVKSNPVLVTVYYKPSITTQPANQTVTYPNAATFSVAASAGNPSTTTYQWQLSTNGGTSWTDISGATAASYTTGATTVAMSGYKYRCLVGNAQYTGDERVVSNVSTLTVNRANGSVTATVSGTPTVGEKLTANVSTVSDGAVTYQWWYTTGSGANVPISGATGNAYIVTADKVGMYIGVTVNVAQGTNYTACSDDSERTDIVKDSEIKITTHPVSQAVKDGSTVSFKVVATGSNLTYKWYYASTNSNASGSQIGSATYGATNIGYTTDTLTLQNIKWSGWNNWYLFAEVSNGTSTVRSNPALVTVYYAPSISSQPVSQTLKAGNTATFTVAVNEGNPTTTYQWQYRANSAGTWANVTSTQGNGGNTATFTTVTTTKSMNGFEYRCVIGNSQYPSVATSNTAILTVYYPPEITTQPKDVIVTAKEKVTFSIEVANGNPTGIAYTWQVKTSSDAEWSNRAYTASFTENVHSSMNGWQYRCLVENSQYTADERVVSDVATLTVNKKSLITSGITVTLNPTEVVYTGSAIDKTIVVATVKDGDETLVEFSDYVSSYSNNTNVGTATVTISGRNDYSDEIAATFKITPVTPTISIENKTVIYTGSTITVDTATVAGVEGGTTPNGAISYTYYTDANCTTLTTKANSGAASDGAAPVNVGKYYAKAVIVAAGNYTEATSNVAVVTINKKSLASSDIKASLETTSYVYTGGAKTPTVTVTDGSITLVKDTDYTFTYTDNVNAGTAAVTIKGIGNYSDEIILNFTITKANESVAVVINGTAEVDQTLSASVTTVSDGVKSYQWWYSDTAGATTGTPISGAVESTYKVTSDVAGKYIGVTVNVAETNNYVETSGDAITTAKVSDSSISITTHPSYVAVKSETTVSFNVVATGSNLKYQWYQADSDSSVGTAISGATNVTYTIEASKVNSSMNGKYYYCEISNNNEIVESNRAMLTVYYIPTIETQPSDITVTATEKATFTIGTKDGNPTPTTYQWQYRENSTGSWIVIDGATGQSYTTETVKVSMNGYEYRCLVGNSQYTDNERVASNAAKLTVGAKELTASGITVELEGTSYTYTGSEIKPEVIVKDETTTLVNDIDYTVTYSENTNVGTATVTITGKENYTGTVTKTFTITKRIVEIKVNDASKEYDATELTSEGYTIISGSLPSGHILKITTAGNIINIGSVINEMVNYTVKNGDADVTANYTVTAEAGTLTITGEKNFSLKSNPNVYYPTLAYAYAAITGIEDTIIVENDTQDSSNLVIESNKKVIIDTNGNTLTKTGSCITNNGELVIDGNGAIQTQDAHSNTLDKIISNTGKLTVSNVTITNNGLTNNNWSVIQSNNSTSVVNISGATLISTLTEGVSIGSYYSNVIDIIDGTLNVYDGEITCEHEGANSSAIRCDGVGEMLIYSGTIESDGGYGINMTGTNTSLTLTAGTIEGAIYGINSQSNIPVVVGTKDGNVSIDSPVVKGGTTGLKVTNGFNFYDGILSGGTNAYEGNTVETEDGYGVYNYNDTLNNAILMKEIVDVTLSESAYVYDGTEKLPTITVSWQGTTLEKDTDYSLYVSDNVNAGVVTVIVTGINDYIGSVTKTYVIAKAEGILEINPTRGVNAVATANHSFTIVKTHGGDVTVNSDKGTASVNGNIVNITGLENVAGGNTVAITVNVAETDNYKSASATYMLAITGKVFNITLPEDYPYEYDGTEKKPIPVVDIDGTVLEEGVDYKVSYEDNIEAGENTAIVIITGIGEYEGSISAESFTIEKRTIALTAGSASKPYDGTPLTSSEYKVTTGSLATGDTLTATTTGSITKVGTTLNLISTYGIYRDTIDVTANYNVTTRAGTLEVLYKAPETPIIMIENYNDVYSGGYIFGNASISQRRNDVTSIIIQETKTAPSGAIAEWDISMYKNKSVMAWLVPNGSVYTLYIGANEKIMVSSGYCLFANYTNCTNITGLDCLNTTGANNMSYMFANSSKLTRLDLTTFDTACVGNMSYMFSGCSGLASVDVSRFDTIRTTNMKAMFSNCSALATLDVTVFDTVNVTDMAGMFENCSALGMLDVSLFDTTSVTNMASMFAGCSNITELNLKRFITDEVKSMGRMFKGCSKLIRLDLSNFNLSALDGTTYYSEADGIRDVNQNEMFNGCSSLKSMLLGRSVSRIDGYNMFNGCNNLVSIMAQSSSAMSLGTNTGLQALVNAKVYVPNKAAETVYEGATSYTTVLGTERVRPMLEILGEDPEYLAQHDPYVDAGATIGGFTAAEATEYTKYGYTLTVTGDEIDTSIIGNYKVIYELKYKNAVVDTIEY